MHQLAILLLRFYNRRLPKADFAFPWHTLRKQGKVCTGDCADLGIAARGRGVCHHHYGLSAGGDLDRTHRHPFGDEFGFVAVN